MIFISLASEKLKRSKKLHMWEHGYLIFSQLGLVHIHKTHQQTLSFKFGLCYLLGLGYVFDRVDRVLRRIRRLNWETATV